MFEMIENRPDRGNVMAKVSATFPASSRSYSPTQPKSSRRPTARHERSDLRPRSGRRPRPNHRRPAGLAPHVLEMMVVLDLMVVVRHRVGYVIRTRRIGCGRVGGGSRLLRLRGGGGAL